MPSCSAVNCSYRHQNKTSGKTVHRFPFSRPDILAKWILNIRRENWYPSKFSVLCSDHFEKSCYENSSSANKCLKKDAIPTVFQYTLNFIKFPVPVSILKTEKVIEPSATAAPKSQCKTEAPQPDNGIYDNFILPDTPQLDEDGFLAEISEHSPETGSPTIIDLRKILTASQNKQKLTQSQEERANNHDCYSDKKKKHFLDKLADAKVKAKVLKKRLKTKQQRIRRLEKTVNSLKESVDHLKKDHEMITEDAGLALKKSLTGVPLDLFQRMLKNDSDKITRESYPQSLRSFAMTLHLYSPRAYDYVRSVFKCALPHPSFFRQCYSAIEEKSGFSEEATRILDTSSELPNEQIEIDNFLFEVYSNSNDASDPPTCHVVEH